MPSRGGKEEFRVGEYYLWRRPNGYWCRAWREPGRGRLYSSFGTRDFQQAKLALTQWYVGPSIFTR